VIAILIYCTSKDANH